MILTPFLTPPDTASLPKLWADANERALAFAHQARWADAAELWATALSDAPTFALAPDTHALLLSNLAQARFRCGDVEDAVELGQRSLAARLFCCDSERDAPMARAQADLAVYLAAAGHPVRAASLFEQAHESLQLQFGDEDERLVSVLENQARLALVVHDTAIAEPLLLRLHALLDSRGEDPSRIEHLIARVAASRNACNSVCNAAESDFPQIMDDGFDLIDDAPHTPMSSPTAQSIQSEGLIEPGSYTTPTWTTKTNPLGFEIQYGVPADESYAAPPRILRDA